MSALISFLGAAALGLGILWLCMAWCYKQPKPKPGRDYDERGPY